MKAVALTVWALLAIEARSAPPTDGGVSEAQKHVDAGDALFREHRYADAIREYEVAMKVKTHPDIVWNLARCHEELHQLEEAVRYFETYRSFSTTEDDRAAASAKLETLGAAIAERDRQRRAASPARLVVIVDAPGATIELPGREPVASGAPFEVAPAPITFRVLAPGHRTLEHEMSLSPGEQRELQVHLDALPEPPPPPAVRPWRWVSLASGVALAAAAGVLYVQAESEYDRIRGAETANGVTTGIGQAPAQRAEDTGNSKVMTANVLVGTGAAALVTSILLFVFE